MSDADAYKQAYIEWMQNGEQGDPPLPDQFWTEHRLTVNGVPITPEQYAANTAAAGNRPANYQGTPPPNTGPAPGWEDAVAKAKASGLGGAYDLAGTNANAPKTAGFDALVGGGQSDTATAKPLTVGTSSSSPVGPATQPFTGPATVAPSGAGSTVAPTQGATATAKPPVQTTQTAATTGGFNALTPQLPALDRPAATSVTAPTVTAPTLPAMPAVPNTTAPTVGQPTAPTLTTPTLNTPAGIVPTTGTTGAGGATGTDPRIQSYLTARPDLLNNWNGDPGYASMYGSLENYIKADMSANGSPEDKAWAATYTPPGTLPAGTTEDPENPPAVAGQNFNQTQNANQSGAFNTVGGTNIAQNRVTGQNTGQTTQQVGSTAQATNQRSDTEQATTEGQVGTQTGTIGDQGTSTSRVDDTLGFGALLKGGAGAAQAADATRQGFLTDLVSTGGSNLQGQVDQAVRQSLTGPQTTGAGDNARARMGGYAAAEIGRRNTGDRLAAAGQLAGPTAVQQLSSAGSPYLGQTQTNNNTRTMDLSNTLDKSSLSKGFQDLASATSGTTATSGNTQGSTMGFDNMVGGTTEAQSGTATGKSTQKAAGVVPEGQTQTAGGGGGCIICTAGLHHGTWRRPRLLRRVVRHKLITEKARFHNAARGYFFLFGPIASLALRSRLVSRLTMPVANAVVYEEARVAGVDLPFRPIPWAIHWTWHGLCSLAGRLPVPDHVTDKAILEVARQHNVLFKVGV